MVFKPVTMADSCSFVSTYDPAIDRKRICERELENHPEWQEGNLSVDQQMAVAWRAFENEFALTAGKDPTKAVELLLFKDGETPTRFVVGAVAPDEFNRILDETQETRTHRGGGNERCWRMFLHGLRNIEGWSGDVKRYKVGELEYVDPAWLKRTFVGKLRTVALQVGGVIMAYNTLTEDEIKN